MAHSIEHITQQITSMKAEIAEVKTALDAFETDIVANGVDADETALVNVLDGKLGYRDIKQIMASFQSEKAIQAANNKQVPV